MGVGGRLLATFFILAMALAAGGCEGCGCDDSDSLAELVEIKGDVERDWASQPLKWRTAETGMRFSLGDGVRARRKSSAILDMNDGSKILLKSESAIRFLKSISSPNTTGIDVETGEAELVVGDNEVQFMSNIGLATLESHTRIRIRKSDGSFELLVAIGKASIQTKREYGGTTNVLEPDEGLKIAIGSAVIERIEKEEPEDSDSSTLVLDMTDLVEDEAVTADASVDPSPIVKTSGQPKMKGVVQGDSGPKYADLTVPVGDTFFIHAARPPVVVEFLFGDKCKNGAAIRIVGKRDTARGKKSANIMFSKGLSKYRIRCLDETQDVEKKVVARGVVRVLRDAGKSRLPKKPPLSQVDADGRFYKISYQNQIPAILFGWPKAPKASKYILHINPGSKGARKITTRTAKHKLASGMIREGTHHLRYEAISPSDRSSKTTKVQIRFDNAAPKASVKEPQEGMFGPGETVEVSGVTTKDWKVSVQGGTITLDKQYRFKGQVNYSGKYRSIALRLVHPRRAVHYYLRRSSK